MICAVYKSSRKEETYLYLPKRDDFSKVPEPLMQMFGTPKLVMLLPLEKKDKLALADISRVRAEMDEKGYYLQLPPPKENLLNEHKKSLGITE
ncbi:YcgL domain-containing protein [Shewanella sp. JM162201]|uniref:YcgL domain-containing protein KJI95_13735 n=1 Tax=Shewanella jiangmenensis TaxID=2837387 RepID=A0ABS5V547_9GAMM|nr:YcgL domain-containing protein [Shewanella jiangmenensis]MBT1445578.1 YcgL domain-containing protein [Shewanella jiangmenensis]